jgi:HK97 gp10 family phage protein
MPASFLVWRGQQASRSVRARLFDDLRRLATDARARARAHCPVDSGGLRDSIDSVPDVRTMRIYIGSDLYYASYVHDGTVYVNARPFMKNGLEEAVASFRFSTSR